jgi:zinc protease
MKQQPTPHVSHLPLAALPGPGDTTRVMLSNGIVILSRANFHSHSVVIQGYLPAGGLFDPDDRLGLAGFTSLALMRGTTRWDFQEIYGLLESTAASLHYSSRTHIVSFGGRALSEDLAMLLDLAAETVMHPVFPDEQIERLRAQLLTSLAIRAQDTEEMASLTFDQIVYAGHPYHRPEDGYPETIQAISRADLENFHRLHYGPRGMVLAIVGAVSPEEAISLASGVFGGWQNPLQGESPTLPRLEPLGVTQKQKVTIPGKYQSDIALGAAGPLRCDPGFLAASLGNNILGQFGMMGRIGETVREKAGLAYYASSSLSGGLGPGPWSISAGVDPENVDRAIELIIQEIDRFTREPVSPEELADSQANYLGSLPLSLESNHGVAGALTGIELYNLGLDYYQRYPDLVNAVTPEQVLEISRKHLDPARLGIAVAGP